MQRLNYFKTMGFRLTLVVAAIVLVGTCLIVGIFVAQDFRKTVANEKLRLTSTAVVFSAATSKPVANLDSRATLEVLRGIRDLPHTTYVSVRTTDGRVLAELGGAVSLANRDGDSDGESNLDFLTAQKVMTEAPIWSNGEQIGTLSIQSSIGWLRTRYLEQLTNMLMVGLLAIFLTALSANWLIRKLTRPLRAMSDKLVAMGQSPDLSQRFDQDRQDEIGILATAFNNAFSGIEERDQALRRHRDSLEETVELRTSELKSAVEEAQHANAAKSDFLATMSHEIRTPMNGMMVMAELLAAAPLTPKHNRYAQVISRSGGTLLNIINDILDMSKIESGRLDLEKTPFSIDALIEDTVSLFSARAYEKGLCLTMCLGSNVATSLIGDPTRLGQVVSNLTNNALKFTETGGVVIMVSAVSANAGNGSQRLRFEVKDTGIGISADKLEHVFDQFTQADQSTTRNFGGTGLGLPISRKLVEAMDGTLDVRSTPGKGTTFFFEISLEIDNSSSQTAPVVLDRPRKVIVADDDPVSSSALGRVLDERGFEVLSPDDSADVVADIVLARPGYLKQLQEQGESSSGPVPLVLIRQYGEDMQFDDLDNQIAGDISIPLKRSDVDAICQAVLADDYSELASRESALSAQMVLPKFEGVNVLAVDDDPVNREVLNESLTALGVHATFASSGEEAVTEYESRDFDLVLMDCSMPGMDGYEATSHLRRIDRERDGGRARVVALTAHVTGAAAERWRSADMDGYISKPFTISRLADELAATRPDSQIAETEPMDAGESRADDDQVETPLIAAEMLEMFATVGAANGGDLQKQVFELFRSHAPVGLKDVLESVQRDDPGEDIARLVHALKSMCNSAGAARAALICNNMEVAANEGVSPSFSDIEKLARTIDQTLSCMLEIIRPDEKAVQSA